MEGGKESLQETVLFNTGKSLGNVAAIILFSVIFSLILNKFNFDKKWFAIVFSCAVLLHFIIQWMIKRRWL